MRREMKGEIGIDRPVSQAQSHKTSYQSSGTSQRRMGHLSGRHPMLRISDTEHYPVFY